jgi:hypothetical protein
MSSRTLDTREEIVQQVVYNIQTQQIRVVFIIDIFYLFIRTQKDIKSIYYDKHTKALFLYVFIYLHDDNYAKPM